MMLYSDYLGGTQHIFVFTFSHIPFHQTRGDFCNLFFFDLTQESSVFTGQGTYFIAITQSLFEVVL